MKVLVLITDERMGGENEGHGQKGLLGGRRGGQVGGGAGRGRAGWGGRGWQGRIRRSREEGEATAGWSSVLGVAGSSLLSSPRQARRARS